MATKKCSKCKEEIQSDAVVCKHCNADMRSWFARHKILTVLLILIGLGVLGNQLGKNDSANPGNNSLPVNTTPPAPVVAEVPTPVTAVDLAKAYEGNEVRADRDYKGKMLEITGVVKDIGVILSSTYIVLSSGKEFSITDVQCFFDDQAEINKVAALAKGSKITVVGRVEGKSLNVAVRGCILK